MPAPTVRGVGTGNSGASNTQTSVSVVLPAGIVAGDVGWAVASVADITAAITVPAGWSIAAGPFDNGLTGGSGHKAWLLSRTMAGTESGATVTVGWSVGTRATLTVVVVAGGTATGAVVVALQDHSADATLDVPAVTPGSADNLLLHLVAMRYASGTGQAVSPASGWTERADHTEGRSAAVNYGGYGQTKALSGQSGVAQAATTAAYSVNTQDIGWVVAVPPLEVRIATVSVSLGLARGDAVAARPVKVAGVSVTTTVPLGTTAGPAKTVTRTAQVAAPVTVVSPAASAKVGVVAIQVALQLGASGVPVHVAVRTAAAALGLIVSAEGRRVEVGARSAQASLGLVAAAAAVKVAAQVAAPPPLGLAAAVVTAAKVGAAGAAVPVGVRVDADGAKGVAVTAGLSLALEPSAVVGVTIRAGRMVTTAAARELMEVG